MVNGPMFLIDSKEPIKTRWDFPGYRTCVKSLEKHGVDYTIQGYTTRIGVERKTVVDLCGRIKNWADFERCQLRKLKRKRHACIIVEGDISWADQMKYYNSIYLIKGVARIMLYGVQVLFAGTREDAMNCCTEYLLAAKNLVDTGKDAG